MAVFIMSAAVFVFVSAWAVYCVVQENRGDRVPALLYHHFAPKPKNSNGDPSNYDPVYFCYDTAFDQQMNHLHQDGYTTISLDDFVAFLDGQKPLPTKPIILTFDDGFMSNYLYAFPILKKYGMTATIFVTLDSNSENFKKYAHLDLPLTLEQMKEMSDYGISMESHTMTHRYLSMLKPADMRWELEESKKVLAKLLDKPVRFLAIPSGAYSGTVKRLVKKSGYAAAFCMLKGTNNKSSDRFELRRLVIGRDYTLEDFKRTLQPASACYLRLTGSLQNALLFALGPGGLDALRSFLYRSKLGRSLIRGQLRNLVPGFALTLIVLLFAGFVAISYWKF